MQDIVGSQKDILKVTLSLQRGTDTASRSFSIDNPRLSMTTDVSTEFQNRLQALRSFLLGEGNKLIQPTSWRDSDNTEEEWTTVDVQFQTTMASIVDWGINKLSRNATFTYNNQAVTTISAATLPVYSTSFNEYFLSYSGMTNADTVFIAYHKLDPSKGDLYFNWWSSPDAAVGNMEISIAKSDTADEDYTGTLIIYLPATDNYAAQTLEIPITN